MKIEKIQKISNQYSIIRQVYEDRVIIRTNNVIESVKYSSFMFLLSNNSCIWTWHVVNCICGKNQFEDTIQCKLVEIRPEDFERVKTYEKSFNNFNIVEEDEIKSYEDLVKIAKEQEAQNLVCKVF